MTPQTLILLLISFGAWTLISAFLGLLVGTRLTHRPGYSHCLPSMPRIPEAVAARMKKVGITWPSQAQTPAPANATPFQAKDEKSRWPSLKITPAREDNQ